MEQCRKVKHPTRKAARGAARRCGALWRETLDVYRCSKCGTWHVGQARSGRYATKAAFQGVRRAYA